MPDYRALITQVQNKGGPLQLRRDDEGPVGITWIVYGPDEDDDAALLDALEDAEVPHDDLEDILCGVLRRDLVRRGFAVYHSTYLHAGKNIMHAVEADGPPHVSGVAMKDMLLAFLRAWLDAAPEAA